MSEEEKFTDKNTLLKKIKETFELIISKNDIKKIDIETYQSNSKEWDFDWFVDLTAVDENNHLIESDLFRLDKNLVSEVKKLLEHVVLYRYSDSDYDDRWFWKSKEGNEPKWLDIKSLIKKSKNGGELVGSTDEWENEEYKYFLQN